MGDFSVIYKVLKKLSEALDYEEFDAESISAERLGISEQRLEQLLIMLQDDGYIQGLAVTQSLSDRWRHLGRPIQPRITLKGLEYLSENSMMKKAANLAKGVLDAVL